MDFGAGRGARVGSAGDASGASVHVTAIQIQHLKNLPGDRFDVSREFINSASDRPDVQREAVQSFDQVYVKQVLIRSGISPFHQMEKVVGKSFVRSEIKASDLFKATGGFKVDMDVKRKHKPRKSTDVPNRFAEKMALC